MIKASWMTAVTLGALLVAGAPTQAQEKTNARPTGAAARAERMQSALDKLNLTDEQKEKFKTLMQDQQEKLRELRSDGNLGAEQLREKRQAIQEDINKKLKEILTSEQFDKLQKMREEMRANLQRRGQPQPAKAAKSPVGEAEKK